MKQPSLFNDLEAAASVPVVVPGIPGSQRALSPAQRRFNTLLDQVSTLRQEQARWRDFMDTYTQRVTGELVPEVTRLRAAQIGLAKLFDGHVAQSRLSKRDRSTVQELLIDLLEQLLQEGETPELRTLYEFHTGTDQTQEEAQDFELLRTMASGLSVDVDAYQGEPNPQDFSDWLDEQLGTRPKPGSERKRRAKTPEPSQPQPPPDDTNVLRRMFRRLASALHPDRESDPEEQRRKTALMQELNSAYTARDLLKILELQRAVDTCAADALGGLDDAALQPYIQLLQAQVKQLREATDALLSPVTAVFPGQTARSLTTARIEKTLDQEIAQVRRIRRNVDADLQRFGDVIVLKDVLAQTRQETPATRRARASKHRR